MLYDNNFYTVTTYGLGFSADANNLDVSLIRQLKKMKTTAKRNQKLNSYINLGIQKIQHKGFGQKKKLSSNTE